jgi:hypothetical protein
MAAENLTEQERAQLRLYTDRAIKVLRIIDELTAETNALRAERDEWHRVSADAERAANAAESRLAGAVGLLVEVLPFAKHWRPSTERAVHAFLASAQPAVPTRFERLVADVGELDVSVLASCAPPAAPASPDDYAAHARWCQPAAPARTEAEQAEQLVLQACREMNVDRDGVGWTRSQLDAVIEAVRVWRDRLGLK